MPFTMREKLAALSYPEKLERVAALIAFSRQFKAFATVPLPQSTDSVLREIWRIKDELSAAR